MADLNNYNDRFDDITYDKEWKRASVPETYTPPENVGVEEPPRKKRIKTKNMSEPREKKPFKFLLLAVQLALCLLILAAAMVFKQFGGESYERLKTAYFEYLNNSLFQTPPGNILDLSEIFERGNSESLPDDTAPESKSEAEPSSDTNSETESGQYASSETDPEAGSNAL